MAKRYIKGVTKEKPAALQSNSNTSESLEDPQETEQDLGVVQGKDFDAAISATDWTAGLLPVRLTPS